MHNFDPATHGWGLFGFGFALFVAVLGFVVTKKPTRRTIIVLIVISFGLMGTGVYFIVLSLPALQDHARRPVEEARLPPSPPSENPSGRPSIEQVFPPESAVDIRPIAGAPQPTFYLADWVSWSASDINLSTWVRENGTFVKISSEKHNYLGSGDNITVTVPASSRSINQIAICVSYLVNKHHVEALHFFSNSDGAGYRRTRDNVSEVDGRGQLCQSMPAPAYRALQ